MSRVGQGPQAGYLSPNINQPDSFTVTGPINTEGLAVFKITAEPNLTTLPASSDNTIILADKAYLQEYDFSTGAAGSPISGQNVLNFGTTSVNTQYGRLAYQGGGQTGGWGNMTQSDIGRQDNPSAYKMNFGPEEAKFVREGCVQFNNVANIGQMYITGTGGATTQWQQLTGNIFQVGYGLGNGSGAQGTRVYADFSQETKYPLDFLKSEQRWFAFSTRRLSYEAEYCMKVYRNNDPTDTLDIGWNSNGYINVAAITSFGNGAIVRCHTWYNQSGNGYHATVPDLASNTTRGPGVMQADGTFRTIGDNSVLALDFNTSQFMVADTGGSGDVDQPLWATVVGAYDVTGQGYYFFDGDDADRTLFFSQTSGTQKWAWGAGTYPTTDIAVDTDDHLFIMQFNGTSSSFRVDGTTAGNSPQNVNTGDNDGMTIGSRYTQASGQLNGKISEIVMFQGNTSMAFTDAWISRYETQTNNYYDIY